MKKAACMLGMMIAFPLFCKAQEGPSLDLLKKSLNKATYSDLVLESVPPTKKEVLPDGSMIAYWNVLTPEGGDMNQYKVCIFNSKGVLTRYKWKRGPFLGGDSKEGSDESSSKAKIKPSGSSSR
jgi:hypothetical protein